MIYLNLEFAENLSHILGLNFLMWNPILQTTALILFQISLGSMEDVQPYCQDVKIALSFKYK